MNKGKALGFMRHDDRILLEIEQRETGKMLIFEPADHVRELPRYYCPTCGQEVKQQEWCPADRHFLPQYCPGCGQKLEPFVAGGADYPDDLFFADTAFVPTLKGDDVTVSKETKGNSLGTASVDAIEAGVVRIVYSDNGETAVLPLAVLPEGIREGDIIFQQNGFWQLDAAASREKKDELKGRLNRLLDRSSKDNP